MSTSLCKGCGDPNWPQLLLHGFCPACAEKRIIALEAKLAQAEAQLTTTVIACVVCGHGVRPRYAIHGMCDLCAGKRIEELGAALARYALQDDESIVAICKSTPAARAALRALKERP